MRFSYHCWSQDCAMPCISCHCWIQKEKTPLCLAHLIRATKTVVGWENEYRPRMIFVFELIFWFVYFSSVLRRVISSNLLSRVLEARDPVQLRFYQVSTLKSSEDPIHLSRRLTTLYNTTHFTTQHNTIQHNTLYNNYKHSTNNTICKNNQKTRYTFSSSQCRCTTIYNTLCNLIHNAIHHYAQY